MDNKLQTVQANPLSPQGQGQYQQTGNDNVMIPNYGTVNINVQAAPLVPPFNGTFSVPITINREYYNLFVIGIEEFDRPYFKVPRSRSLCEYMSDETKQRFWDDVPCVLRSQNYRIRIEECTFDDVAEIDSFAELQEIDSRYRV